MMDEPQNLNYNRIAEAIEYIKNNFREQPNLDEVARKVHLSPFHFQRLLSERAGTTPKKYQKDCPHWLGKCEDRY